MTRGWKQMLVVAAGLGLAAAPVLAQDPGRGKGPGAGGPGWGGGAHGPGEGLQMEKAARALGLSDEQRASLEQLQAQHRADVRPLVEDSRRLHEEVRQALESGSADPAAVGERVIQAHGLMAQVKELRTAFDARFEGLLTPEQRETWKTLQEARERMRGAEDGAGRRGPGHRRPGGPAGPPPEAGEPAGN